MFDKKNCEKFSFVNIMWSKGRVNVMQVENLMVAKELGCNDIVHWDESSKQSN
jgi:hypothetical protein